MIKELNFKNIVNGICLGLAGAGCLIIIVFVIAFLVTLFMALFVVD